MSLRFDEKEDFKTNLERFLTYMESEDPEMGAILRANVSLLQNVTDDATRRTARTLFNLNVTSQLSSLVKKPDKDVG